ncbi:hypothetical protein DPMN_092619 [Dreissena polymorpha]|uniref:Uncharacterized protein n=1 Tax=Dreissena polymorpha TaxID=45954 RepID=A0A9D4L421_DREPO|nr:hypothetical protein DPMN_092619 [Dreissena polymorpha]
METHIGSFVSGQPAESSRDSTEDDGSDDCDAFSQDAFSSDVSTNLTVVLLKNATRNLMPPKSERTSLI